VAEPLAEPKPSCTLLLYKRKAKKQNQPRIARKDSSTPSTTTTRELHAKAWFFHSELAGARSIVGPGTVVARLRAVEVVALRVSAFLLAGEAGAETARGVRPAGGAVALAAGPVRLVFTSVGLGLLLMGLVISKTCFIEEAAGEG
jgi:hypothetical protein